MVIIATAVYPTESAKEFTKRYLELPPLPAYITLRGLYATSEVGVGFKGIAIYEYDQSKFNEVMEVLGARYAKCIGVPGLTYSFYPWLEAKELLKSIGMG